ncbi:TPA: hypothetical protein QIM62_004855, partial [Klebsiella aerogenes]|nr:hypothetical protein [Klebsiella aerogenes]
KIAATVTTDKDGQAKAALTSMWAGSVTVTAKVQGGKGDSMTTPVSFTADSSTARMKALTVTQNNAAANGLAKNEVQVTVQDANGNLVKGAVVSLVADHEA